MQGRQVSSKVFLASLWSYPIPTDTPEANGLVTHGKELVVVGGRCSMGGSAVTYYSLPVDVNRLPLPTRCWLSNKQAHRVSLLP